MPISELLTLILAGLVMLVGLAGTIVPVLPGPTLILLVVAGYCLLNGFGERGGQLLGTMALLAIAVRDSEAVARKVRGHPGRSLVPVYTARADTSSYGVFRITLHRRINRWSARNLPHRIQPHA